MADMEDPADKVKMDNAIAILNAAGHQYASLSSEGTVVAVFIAAVSVAMRLSDDEVLALPFDGLGIARAHSADRQRLDYANAIAALAAEMARTTTSNGGWEDRAGLSRIIHWSWWREVPSLFNYFMRVHTYAYTSVLSVTPRHQDDIDTCYAIESAGREDRRVRELLTPGSRMRVAGGPAPLSAYMPWNWRQTAWEITCRIHADADYAEMIEHRLRNFLPQLAREAADPTPVELDEHLLPEAMARWLHRVAHGVQNAMRLSHGDANWGAHYFVRAAVDHIAIVRTVVHKHTG